MLFLRVLPIGEAPHMEFREPKENETLGHKNSCVHVNFDHVDRIEWDVDRGVVLRLVSKLSYFVPKTKKAPEALFAALDKRAKDPKTTSSIDLVRWDGKKLVGDSPFAIPFAGKPVAANA